jgi:biotin carboxyl carrier protein
MERVGRWWVVFAVVAAASVSACSPAARTITPSAGASGTSAPVATTTTSTTTTSEPPPPPPPVRDVHAPAGAAFATIEGVTLVHPADHVERVAFHQSNHDGARELEPTADAAAPVVLESRERDTPARTAADVVVEPGGAIRAPVTGVVKRSGGYTLYCKYHDDYAVIAPDAAPHLEVKILHIAGVQVRRGQRVVAGETVLAPGPTQLPFESQVDGLATAPPAWPHVHIEVVDPSIRDRPTPGGGCS